jgi:membrane associated rhomboid family serine protease
MTKITKFPNEAERQALAEAKNLIHKKPPPSEPMFNLPRMTKLLVLVNLGVFLVTEYFPSWLGDEQLYDLAFISARYSGDMDFGMAALTSPVTHLFLHAGWLHLLMNMGSLLAFGAGLERAIGGKKLLALYLASGLVGALLHLLVYPHMQIPMIGASGAVSGLFGGILMMMYYSGGMGTGYRKLLPFVLIWVGMAGFFGFFGVPGTDNPIAWTTHIGGFLGGMALYRPILRWRL